MVDFVKNKMDWPVGSQLLFAKGLPNLITTDNTVWLRNGLLETDKSKFDVNFWKSTAYCAAWATDLSIDTPALTFTQLALGKASGKRLVLFTKADGNILYGTKDDGKTIVPILTDDRWLGQVFVFWYKNRFFVQTTTGVSSVVWDGTDLAAPVIETNLATALSGSNISCVNVLGDKIVLGTADGKLFTSNDGVTWPPVAVWNSSAEKLTVDVCKITSVAISKTGDTFAAAGYSTTTAKGFIVQVNDQFIGTGQTLVFNDSFTVKDSSIVHCKGYWICGTWYWDTTPDKRVALSNLFKGAIPSSSYELNWFDLGDQIGYCQTGQIGYYVGEYSDFFLTVGLMSGVSIATPFYKTAFDLEDRVIIALDIGGNKLTTNKGIVAGTPITGVYSTHTRIK